MKFKNLFLSCAIVLAGVTGPLWADDEDGLDYDDDTRGTIDGIDLGKRTIIIDDWVYNLALNLKVHEGGKLATDFALRERVNVDFEIDPRTAEDRVQMITDIRILGNNE